MLLKIYNLISVPVLLISSISSIRADYTNFDSLYPEVKNLITSSKNYTAAISNDGYWKTDANSSVSNKTEFWGSYDFIIIGGGTAGGVLANRLTEENFTVLMIEAGSKTPDTSAVSGASTYLLKSQYNWGFVTTPQKNACFGSPNNRCDYSRGKVLGGSSALNGGVYSRGNAEDFNKWEKLGNSGWSYNDVLPYFKKSEYANFSQNIDTIYHGFDGLQSVSVAEDTPIYTQTILDGFSELGFKELDYNGREQIGYGRFQVYKTFNVRSSTNYSFIRPAADRPNLHILTDSLVTKIRIKKCAAEGVEFIKNGQKYYVKASKEVLLSAGSVSSPQVLMLSGIGPTEHLKELGINPIVDLPVGQYFQDHTLLLLTFKIQQPFETYSTEEATRLWLENKRPWNVGYNCQVLNCFSFTNSPVPDIELSILGPSSTTGNVSTGKIFVILLNPLSIGEITLASNNPQDFPLINPNYFANETDVESLYKGIQKALALLNTTYFKKYNAEISMPTIKECDKNNIKLSKDWWVCQLRSSAATAYHPVASTRMGNSNKTSVVDSNLKVHGIKKLRVVDAGIIPVPTTGHTNAPTVMIAEKIAESIKKEYSI